MWAVASVWAAVSARACASVWAAAPAVAAVSARACASVWAAAPAVAAVSARACASVWAAAPAVAAASATACASACAARSATACASARAASSTGAPARSDTAAGSSITGARPAPAAGIGVAGTPLVVWTSASAGRDRSGPAGAAGRTRAVPRAGSGRRTGGHGPGTGAEPRAVPPGVPVGWPDRARAGSPGGVSAASSVLVRSAERWSAMTAASASGDSMCWMKVTGGRSARSGGWSGIRVRGGHRAIFGRGPDGPPVAGGSGGRTWPGQPAGRPGLIGPGGGRMPGLSPHLRLPDRGCALPGRVSGDCGEEHGQRPLRTLARAARRPFR